MSLKTWESKQTPPRSGSCSEVEVISAVRRWRRMMRRKKLVTGRWRGVRGGGEAGRRYFLSSTSSFLPADMSDSRPFATVGSCVTPAGAPVQLTGPSPGESNSHLLSRLDRPPVTHHAVKPWPGVFEIWQHNQFPWFMTGLQEAERAERAGSWKRSADGECWRQRLADVYSGGGSSSWRCPLLARPSRELWLPCEASLVLLGEARFYSREKVRTSGSATVQWRFPPGARVTQDILGRLVDVTTVMMTEVLLTGSKPQSPGLDFHRGKGIPCDVNSVEFFSNQAPKCG